jgi:endonuclease/exonuclease/phosphatase family metal-dependent hydrolase
VKHLKVIALVLAQACLAPLANAGALSLVTYNVSGNGVSDWSTNSAQVRAIGRQLACLESDIIAFNEIPNNFVWQMTNFVAAFLPGFYLATNSIGDGYIRNGVASRYPIVSSSSHLHGSSLAQFGYSSSGFTRDLFQARVAVPGFPAPLHVFVAHLKATGSSNPQDDANRRAAEAAAVSNYIATVFLPGPDGLHPYLLAGDLNEDISRPETNRYVSGRPVQRLGGAATGLQITTPVNPVSHTDFTESIRGTLDARFDYILPCTLLFSNVTTSQVFRTDLLSSPAPPLLATDDKTASDHLPVMVVFGNPYAAPLRFTLLTVTNQVAALAWTSVRGQTYCLEASADVRQWTAVATDLVATSETFTTTVSLTNDSTFFRVSRPH